MVVLEKYLQHSGYRMGILSSVRIAAVLCMLHEEILQCCDPHLQGCHTVFSAGFDSANVSVRGCKED